MASDEEDSIFNTNFVMRRSQSPPGGESQITMDTAHSHDQSDEEESQFTPSLNDLTSVSSRPDPRARARYHSDLSGRSGTSSAKISDHSGSTRKASHRHADVEARRRRRNRRREEPLYEESDDEEDSTIVSYFTSFRGRDGQHQRGGYSSGMRQGHSSRKRGNNAFVTYISGVFEGINLKTALLCVLAMVAVVQLGQKNNVPVSGVSEDETVEQFLPAELMKGEEGVKPNIRGGMLTAEDETGDDDEDNAELGNIGLYADEHGSPKETEETETGSEEGYSNQMSGMFQQPMVKSGDGYMQQHSQQLVGGYSGQIGGQYGQPGMAGQFVSDPQQQQQQQQQPFMQGFRPQQSGYSNSPASMIGGSYSQQGGKITAQQPSMTSQSNMMNQQMGGQYGSVNGNQMTGYPNGPMGMNGQYGQQQQAGMGSQYAQPMGGYPNSQMGMQGQAYGQQQNLAYGGGMQQQPMIYPGQLSPLMGQQAVQSQQGMGQYPQQQQLAAFNPMSSSEGSVVSQETALAGLSSVQSEAQSGQVSQSEAQVETESEVPLLKDVPKGYVPPAVPAAQAVPPVAPSSTTDTLPELNNFKDSWDPYAPTDIPMFWHIPKAGGSSIKDALGGCHRFVQATEFGVTDGHINDKEVAIVYPKVPGGADTDRSPFVNIDSSTVSGIQRAKDMGFADSQLADIVVSPFVFETNDLFTQTAKGRFFSVFRHPIDRAISMFYYIQVADWEPSYKPELKEWTLEQYAQSDVVENNWMTRQLSGQLGGELTDANLQKAMEVVRRKFMVGLMTQIEKSMTRFEKFFRWKYKVNPTNQEACRERLMSGGSNSNKANKKPLPKEGEPAWDLLAHQNNFDMQLYKYIEQLFEEQEVFVAGIPDNFRLVDATCCKCDPPTYPPEGFTCPDAVKNG